MRGGTALLVVMLLAGGLTGCLSSFDEGALESTNTTDGAEGATGPEDGRPELSDLDDGRSKFLGNIWTAHQQPGWQDHWTQVTPANEGKWGAVQPMSPLTYTWDDPWEDPTAEPGSPSMDETYAFAKDNGYPVRYHALVWGNSQPYWMAPLPPDQQREHIEDWFAAVAKRYPDLDWIEVVNEPIHDPPDCDNQPPRDQGSRDCGDYVEALGGYDGTDGTGFDWVLNAFRLARDTFGPDAKLMLNEYINPDEHGVLTRYVELIELLQEEDLIDGIGIQQHWHETEVLDTKAMRERRDRLAATGLPVQVTELDIAGSGPEAEASQLSKYRQILPVWWEHPSVEAVTLWGWKPPMFNAEATLVRDDGSYKPALHWLLAYTNEIAPVITPDQALVLDGNNGNVIGSVKATDWAADIGRPDLRTFHWRILGGTSASGFAIDETTGDVTIGDPNAIEFHRRNHALTLTVNDGFHTSDEEEVTVTIADEIVVCHESETTTVQRTTVPDHLGHGDALGTC